MIRALLYLRLMSLKNALAGQLRRLRQPKYLAGVAFLILYFWFFFFRGSHSAARMVASSSALGQIPRETAPVLLGIGASALLVLVVLMWILPKDNPGVRFTEAEIAFLFPAPLSRRGLIHFKVLSMQLGAVLQSVFFALLFSNRNLLHGHTAKTLLSWWVVIGFVGLHRLGSSLTIARLSAAGVHTPKRRWLLFGGLAVLALVVGLTVWRELPDPTMVRSVPDWLADAFGTGALRWLLWPTKLVLAPFFAEGLRGFLFALAPAVALLALHYWWVVNTDIAFEEASLAQAERLAARVAELRRTGSLRMGTTARKGRRPPFNVSRARWVELAFLWKNLLSTANSWLNARTWRLVALGLAIASIGLRQFMGSHYWMAGGFLAALGAIAIGMALFYGPLLTRLDLRQDLANADILRTYPLPGWRIVLGEMLAPTAILTGIILLGLLAFYLGLQGHQPPALSKTWFAPTMKIVLVACAAGLTPFVVALQLLVPNGAAVLFPGMFRVAQVQGGGLDQMGQRMLFGFGQMFVLVFIFLPAGAISLGGYFMVHGVRYLLQLAGLVGESTMSPMFTAIFLTIVFAAAVAGEIWCGVWWLGERFERFDLSAELRP